VSLRAISVSRGGDEDAACAPRARADVAAAIARTADLAEDGRIDMVLLLDGWS
jgi:hypothetical protein